jgi:RHS repeat-associated protein
VSYGWDDNGNLTSRGADSFAWDAEDRLTSATVGSVTATFAYNGDGLRDSLTTGGNTTTFTWDVNRSIPQVLDDEDFRYVYGIGLVSQISGSGTNYFLSDGLRSTMALTDEAGLVLNEYEYDVYGGLRSSSGSQSNPFTFASEQTDDSTDLQYLRARYYDFKTGTFLSRDVLPGFASNPLSQNRFTYAFANPVVFSDPSGFCPGEGDFDCFGSGSADGRIIQFGSAGRGPRRVGGVKNPPSNFEVSATAKVSGRGGNVSVQIRIATSAPDHLKPSAHVSGSQEHPSRRNGPEMGSPDYFENNGYATDVVEYPYKLNGNEPPNKVTVAVNLRAGPTPGTVIDMGGVQLGTFLRGFGLQFGINNFSFGLDCIYY